MQNPRTIKFWDDYHQNHHGGHDGAVEWLVDPSGDHEWDNEAKDQSGMVKLIWSQILHHCCCKRPESTPLRILEIGCGTSRMARNIFLYHRNYSNNTLSTPTTNTNNNNHNESAPRWPTMALHILSTDVSEVAIQHNRTRDAALLRQNHQQDEEVSWLDYVALDVVQPSTEQMQYLLQVFPDRSMQEAEEEGTPPDRMDHGHTTTATSTSTAPATNLQVDVILDKGCLDTFLFRTRQRGATADVAQAVVSRLHTWLSSSSSSSSSLKSSFVSSALYLVCSPRSRWKILQQQKNNPWKLEDRLRLNLDAGLSSTKKPSSTTSHNRDDDDSKPVVRIGKVVTGNNSASSLPNSSLTKKDQNEHVYFYVWRALSHEEQQDKTAAVSMPASQSQSTGVENDLSPCLECGRLPSEVLSHLGGRTPQRLARAWLQHKRHCHGPKPKT